MTPTNFEKMLDYLYYQRMQEFYQTSESEVQSFDDFINSLTTAESLRFLCIGCT